MILALLVAVAQPSPGAAATLKFVDSLYDPATGGYRVEPGGPPGLRACNGAGRATRYLGGQLRDKEKTAAFVLGCYDATTGSFREPNGKPDAAITCIGLMAAVELGVPKEKFAGAVEYIGKNAKAFEEVRLAAAAAESYGPGPFLPYRPAWYATAKTHINAVELQDPKDGGAREIGGVVAMYLRIHEPMADLSKPAPLLNAGQRPDGGWGKKGATASDLDSTYRVVRAFHLLKERPADTAAVAAFVKSCRNADGGYGVTAGAKSSMSGVYYAAILNEWLAPRK